MLRIEWDRTEVVLSGSPYQAPYRILEKALRAYDLSVAYAIAIARRNPPDDVLRNVGQSTSTYASLVTVAGNGTNFWLIPMRDPAKIVGVPNRIHVDFPDDTYPQDEWRQ